VVRVGRYGNYPKTYGPNLTHNSMIDYISPRKINREGASNKSPLTRGRIKKLSVLSSFQTNY
jgi:hypothetical protein